MLKIGFGVQFRQKVRAVFLLTKRPPGSGGETFTQWFHQAKAKQAMIHTAHSNIQLIQQ